MRQELQAASELPAEDQQALAALIDRARRHRRRQFAASLEEAAQHLPRLIRIPAKKLLFGRKG